MTRTPRSLNGARRGLLTAAAILCGLACDPELDLDDDPLQARSNDEYPTPGGSHCKGCIRDFAVRGGRLQLCVDISLARIEPWLPFLPPAQLSTWYAGDWSIWDAESSDYLCPDCTFELVPTFSSAKSSYALIRSQPLPISVSKAPEALWLRSLSYPPAALRSDSTAYLDVITAEVEDIDGAAFHCPPREHEIQPIDFPETAQL